MTKAERMEKMRAEAMGAFELGELVRVGTGEFVKEVEGGFVEVRFVVKGEGFDLDEARGEYLRKVAEAEKRKAEAEKRKAEKAAKGK